ncbi:hypothetical protein T492DRAFT_844872 [Pavlovales sp. CCMP2436]|nr:hypothetical protein T492DRAFT_844872 [Pavlovales sp. CCMP2436]
MRGEEEKPEVEAPLSSAESITFLRARGVEVDLPEERGAKGVAAAPEATGPGFGFVRIPADDHAAVSAESAPSAPSSDVLPGLLRPRFADAAAMDEQTVMRETAARMKNMLHSGGEGSGLKAPSASAMTSLASGGACEAYPLAQASDANGGRAVRRALCKLGAPPPDGWVTEGVLPPPVELGSTLS